MEIVLIGIGALMMLVAFVCCILVIVKMFQNQMTGIGSPVLLDYLSAIGYILTLIYGWQTKLPGACRK